MDILDFPTTSSDRLTQRTIMALQSRGLIVNKVNGIGVVLIRRRANPPMGFYV